MLQFEPIALPEHSGRLRDEVRAFLDEHMPRDYRPNSDFTSGHDPQFSRKLGARGWIGMPWPKAYGGGEYSNLDRYVVTEELLAAGAPVIAHWFADRQTGPLLLRFGTQQQRQRYLPAICRGECFFSIGMSEPDTGSDLASIRTRAEPVDGGWRVNGTKLWTTSAHLNHHMMVLVRTQAPTEQRHAGMSQLVIDLDSDGVSIRPIRNMAGKEEFNEVVFTDVFVPGDNLVGQEGDGWAQVTSELAFERSGPERFLSVFRVYVEYVRLIGPNPSDQQAAVAGRIASHLLTLRRLSISVAGMLAAGAEPATEAALVKELGNNFEKMLPELARLAAPAKGDDRQFRAVLNDALLLSPAITLRGGTREILRGVIARGLGLR